jgi:Fic family protein
MVKKLALRTFMAIFMAMIHTSNIQITPEILALIAQIDEFKGAWRAFGSLAPERLLALRHIATVESVASSTRIEGSKLTNAEVSTLLGKLKIKEFSTRDEQEVAGYADVMELLFASWENITFNENHITQLHRDLLAYSTKDEHHRGKYKTISNSVAAFDADGQQVAVIFETATPFDTPRLMRELIDWVRYARDNKALHPLLIVAVFVVVFLEIHPFQDGNGRLSRILTTLLMMQLGYAYVPYSSLESIIEQNKQGYYLALRQTQGSIRTDAPNWQPWLVFFLNSLSSQVKRLGEKMEREKLLSSLLPKLAADILELAKQHGRMTTALAQQMTAAKRSTIKAHLTKLAKDGLLVQHGTGRGTWYTVAEKIG